MLSHDESFLLHLTIAYRAPLFANRHTLKELTNSAFVTAYLLTGSAASSEAAVQKAIEKWDPSAGSPTLIREAASAALSQPAECLNDFALPELLERVMRLPERLRRCFVLRCLVGLTTPAAGRLLSLEASRVDQCTSTAMRSLAERACE